MHQKVWTRKLLLKGLGWASVPTALGYGSKLDGTLFGKSFSPDDADLKMISTSWESFFSPTNMLGYHHPSNPPGGPCRWLGKSLTAWNGAVQQKATKGGSSRTCELSVPDGAFPASRSSAF